MFDLSKVDPIIIDVSFIVLLVLILFFGIIRGIKSVSINLLLVTVSIFLGFVSYTSDLKEMLIKFLKVGEWLPAGSTNAQKFGFAVFSNFISSVLVALLFFIVLKLVALMVSMLIKRRNVNREKGQKSKVGRVFGGLLNCIYGFVVLLVLVLTFNNNLLGTKKLVEKTKVVKPVANFAEKNIDRLNGDLLDMVAMKVMIGDVLYDVDYEMIEAYNYFDSRAVEILDGIKYVDDLTSFNWNEQAKNRIEDLYEMAIISNRFAKNNASVKEKFIKVYEEVMAKLEATKESNEKVVINANKHGLMKIAFSESESGLSEENLNRFLNITQVG